MSSRKSLSFCLAFFLCTLILFSDSEKKTLVIEISGGKKEVGQFIVSVFTSEDSFLKKPFLERKVSVDGKGQAVLIFEFMDEKYFAISVVYDENLNNKLDTGFLGIPKEKVGFSNNARGTFGPPKYRDAKINLSEVSKTSIRVGKADK